MGSATHVAIVNATSWKSTRGGISLWQKSGSTWTTYRKNIPVWLGRNGFRQGASRHEGDGTTPAGKYPMRFAFGGKSDPGVHLGYRDLAPNTCWSGERADYNTWVRRTCTSVDENLWASLNGAYQYAAVVGFNDDPAVWQRGSAIFLHVSLNKPTSGCVSMKESDLLSVLHWMPAGSWVVMGPNSYVSSLG